jgi:energy-coupling factor transporter ATP-binding protein EcfA2
MIHKLTLQNFKGIESAELSFERLTVLVGPNASGKTSVLQALDLLSAFADPDTQRSRVIQQYGGIPALKRGNQTTLLVQAEGEWERKPGSLRMELKPRGDGPQHALEVKGQWGDQAFDIQELPRDGAGAGLKLREVDLFGNVALPALDWTTGIFLRLEARRLAEPSYAESVEPRIDTDGAGLASVLAQMALNRPDDFAELLGALRAVIPQVVRVRLSLAEIKRQEAETLRIDEEPVTRHVTRTYSGHRILFDTKSGTGIPGEAASEGTLLVLGLLTVLMSTPRPKLVLLDDLDRGLHPKAQSDLMAQLRTLLERDPELQIIATSHSPYLVDHLDPREVRLSTVLPDGTIRFAALTDHPEFERWKEAMRPGEFWSTVGERWVGEREAENS